MVESDLILGDITVLDLSQGLSGPFCTKLLAGLGATVIDVEQPGTGQSARRAGPFLSDDPHRETSGTFLYLNTGKKSITLDYSSETGASILKQLVKSCDIVVEDSPYGAMEKLGLGYLDLSLINPLLIYTSVTPFGITGPYRDYKGSDIIAQASGALMQTVGMPDREPLKIGGNVALYTAGISSFSGTMLALHVRDEEGYGQQVDVSAMETITVAQIHASIHSQFRGSDAPRRESSLIKAKDGWVNPGLTIGLQEDTWVRMCEIMGKPELATDPAFSSREARRENQEDMLAIIEQWSAEIPKEEIYHIVQGLRTIAGYVADVSDLFSSRQFVARQFFQSIDHPFAGLLQYPGGPFSITDEVWEQSRAPLLGEHNVEIFCEGLGYSKEDLVRLANLGTI